MRFKDKNILILIGIFILSLFFLQAWVRGDGILYYSYVRSLIIDGDFQFSNEFSDAIELNKLAPPALRGIKEYRPSTSIGVGESLLPLTKTGHLRNRYPVGTPLLWSPFFLLSHILVNIFNKFGAKIPTDGYSFLYIMIVSFGSCLYAFIGLILSYKVSSRYFSKAVSLGATAAIWWASPLPAYMYGHPMLSHTSSVFAASLLVFLYLKAKDEESYIRWAILGFICGLAVIVRLQDGLFLLIPAAELLRQYHNTIKYRGQQSLSKVINKNLLFSIGFLFGILPQLVVGKILYGVYNLNFYHETQKEHLWRWSSPPIFQVLFSSCHGLFSWTPILLAAVIGLYFLYRKDRWFAVILIIIFLLQLYLISGSYNCLSGLYVWEYSSFGGRMFLSCVPIFILGLAALTEALRNKMPKSWLILLGCGLILWNLGFILQFGLGLIPREGNISWREMIRNQFTIVPSLIYKRITNL